MKRHLKLAVGPEGVEIDTVPQVMANASPVFCRMLQPHGFAEGQKLSKTKALVVPLPEDDVPAMTILCDIFHLRSNKVPIKGMTSDTMADIATLVDKYDCAAAIQPWPRIWFTQVLERQGHKNPPDMSLGEVGKWIHISCHLGLAEQFSQFTSVLIRRASHKDFRQGPMLLDYQKLSQSVQDSIENARDFGIDSWHKLCCKLIEDLKEGNHCKFTASDTQESAFNCSSLVLGNALLAAKEICSGENWEKSDNWTGSIDHYHQRMTRFAERLNGPQRVYFDGRGSYSYDRGRHSDCSLSAKVLEEINEIYRNCTAGLRLEVVGNHAYRASDGSGDESKE